MHALTVSIDAGVATLTLNRPERRNAFDDALLAALTEAIAELGASDAVRVIVLAAQGPVFCAGADLQWMRAMADATHEANRADAARLAALLHALDTCPRPTVARIQGDAIAGGVGLVAACDIAVCVDTARFALSELRLGLIPATISPYLVRAMGLRATQRQVLTAQPFTAAEALRLGLVHELVPADALDGKLGEIVQALRAAGPQAAAAAKRLLREVAGRAIDATLIAQTAQAIADSRASPEAREGVQAFLDKRPPAWRAR